MIKGKFFPKEVFQSTLAPMSKNCVFLHNVLQGGHKHNRSISPDGPQGYSSKAADGARKERRIDGERDSVRDYGRGHGRRGSDIHVNSDRHSYGRNRDYHGRSDEYSYNRRHGGNDDREYQRYSSRAARESKSGARSEYSRRDDDYQKLSRDDRWNSDKGTRVKDFDEASRKRKDMEKDRDKDDGNRDRNKNLDRDVSIEKSKNGGKHLNVDMDIEEEKHKERDEMVDVGRDRGRNRDENKEYSRDIGDRGEPRKGRDDVKGRGRDDSGDRDEARNRARDKHKNIEKDTDAYKDDKVQHRKRDDVRERDRYKEKHIRETDRHSKTEAKASSFYKDRDEKERDRYQDGDEGSARKGQENEHGIEKLSRSVRDGKHQSDLYDKDGRRRQPISENAGQIEGKGTLLVDDKKSDKSTNKLPEAQGLSESASSIAAEAEVAHDLNAAKLAAMKAAELVNKNLGVSGSMSADQKKKLLWGSKKAAAPVESGSNCWEMAHFADPDRQEKFNKLMSLSAPCYIWPIVGCQGRIEDRKEGRRKRWAVCCREAKGIAAGLREAVYSRTEATRWSDCWIRFIGILVCDVCVTHLDYLLGKVIIYLEFPIIFQVHWAASSDNDKLTKSFWLMFACHLKLPIFKKCNSLCCRTSSWHNLYHVCIFLLIIEVKINCMLPCTTFGCSIFILVILYFRFN
ncbi:uncharacterized protein LOC131029158 isoform X2 [Cryptomeria japonica]|uniref:uncharacterized protein LOC131029158 isoform X2 n=2 Tax=Cryptomeria japonica TaxID=3369 RepID=UPI0025ACD36A|nr:uncharacterized protein LOC131029158 isoform X2 [Cryptomeria japonica]